MRKGWHYFAGLERKRSSSIELMEEEATEGAGRCPVYDRDTVYGDADSTQAQGNSLVDRKIEFGHLQE